MRSARSGARRRCSGLGMGPQAERPERTAPGSNVSRETCAVVGGAKAVLRRTPPLPARSRIGRASWDLQVHFWLSWELVDQMCWRTAGTGKSATRRRNWALVATDGAAGNPCSTTAGARRCEGRSNGEGTAMRGSSNGEARRGEEAANCWATVRRGWRGARRGGWVARGGVAWPCEPVRDRSGELSSVHIWGVPGQAGLAG